MIFIWVLSLVGSLLGNVSEGAAVPRVATWWGECPGDVFIVVPLFLECLRLWVRISFSCPAVLSNFLGIYRMRVTGIWSKWNLQIWPRINLVTLTRANGWKKDGRMGWPLSDQKFKCKSSENNQSGRSCAKSYLNPKQFVCLLVWGDTGQATNFFGFQTHPVGSDVTQWQMTGNLLFFNVYFFVLYQHWQILCA